MLQLIRSKAGSLIVKILFAFLILSFAVWGIGDIFRDRGADQTVAEVGGTPISLAEVDTQFKTDVDRLRRQIPGLTLASAASFGLLQASLDQLVDNRLYDLLASDLGYALPDAVIVQQIQNDPSFRDPATGQFSRDVFLSLLRSNNLSEPGFVASLERDLTHRQLGQAVTAGATAPATLADALYRFRRETRTADTVTIRDADQAGIPAPAAADLTAYHEAHADRFQSPEYRAFSVVSFDAADLAANVTVTPEEVENYYTDHPAEFELPERRSFDQAIAPTQELAQQLAEAVAGGQALQQAVDVLGNAALSFVPIEPTARADMPVEALADAAFALPEGGATEPVETPFGWHVLVLTEVQPAGAESFEDARARIDEQLKEERAADSLYETANQFDDLLAGGTGVPDAAAQLGLAVTEVPPIAEDGTTQDGSPLPVMAAADRVIPAAFALAEGEESRLTETGDGGYFIVKLDRIVPPATLPLDQVRDEVTAAWTAEKQAEVAKAVAETVKSRLDNGEEPAAVAEAVGGQAATTAPLLRDGSNADTVPSAAVEALFATSPGGVVVAEIPGGQLVARLKSVDRAEPGADAEAEAQIRDDARASIAGDLMAQFMAALRRQYDVEVDPDALARLNYQG